MLWSLRIFLTLNVKARPEKQLWLQNKNIFPAQQTLAKKNFFNLQYRQAVCVCARACVC